MLRLHWFYFALVLPIIASCTNGVFQLRDLNSPIFFVVDELNHRVLGWDALPRTSQLPPGFVLGQSNFSSANANDPVLSATTLSLPQGVFSDGTRLYIADGGNNRVLVWNSLPITNGQAADFALGQPDLDSNVGGTTAITMSSPTGVYSTGSQLFVVDKGNNRVLVWNTIPTMSGEAADFALGQPGLLSGSSNNPTFGASSMNQPVRVLSDGSRLFVTDTNNHRVLVWNIIPTSAAAIAAHFVLGQTNLTTAGGTGVNPNQMNAPLDIYSDGTRLYVADQNNHRVLAWNTLSGTDGQAANFVLGQPTTVSNTPNIGGRSDKTLSFPTGLYSDGIRFYVADLQNHRILGWNTLPTTIQQAADFVLGQPSFITGNANAGGLSATSLNFPVDL